MNSPSNLEASFREPERRAVPRMSVADAFPDARGALELRREDCVSGIGVVSLLACVACRLPAAEEVGLGTGGMYVYPSAGVKIGRVEAEESIFVRELTVESYFLLAISPPSRLPHPPL